MTVIVNMFARFYIGYSLVDITVHSVADNRYKIESRENILLYTAVSF